MNATAKQLDDALAATVKTAVSLSQQEPDRVVSVFRTRRIGGSWRYAWSGVRFDDVRSRFEDGDYVSVIHKAFKAGEEIAV